MSFKNYGNIGHYKDDTGVYTFQIGEAAPSNIDEGYDSIDLNDTASLSMPVLLTVGKNKVLIKGSNNQLPDEIKVMFSTNRLLPELIDKQYRILYGKGLCVYREVFEDRKLYRDWQTNETIENWLSDWQTNGLQDDPNTYIEKVIKDNYYFEDYWVRWRMFKGRRIGALPVAGLEHLENRRCRLSTKKQLDIFSGDYEDRDFNNVVVGNWGVAFERSMKVYKRMRLKNAAQFDVGVSYHKHHLPGEIYGFNKFYFGIKPWLTATNRNPEYINSYLEHALSAKKHVKIPWEWVEAIDNKLEDYCKKNQELEEEGKTLLKPNDIEIGTEYHVALRDAYIKAEMRKMTSFLTGVKNQGKTFTTYSFQTDKGIAEWKIEEIDMKYKEYITSLIDYDKRADEVTLSSKGIDASISNISKDGVISKSGSDLLYNYIIYLLNLTPFERVSCEAINWAIRVNFPAIYKKGYRVGLYSEIPSRQEEVSPNDRFESQLNQTTQSVNQRMDNTDQVLQQILQKLS